MWESPGKNTRTGCRQPGPKLEASKTSSSKKNFVTGAFKRSSPNGGSAKGIPVYLEVMGTAEPWKTLTAEKVLLQECNVASNQRRVSDLHLRNASSKSHESSKIQKSRHGWGCPRFLEQNTLAI